jgi:Uma2 family endonuclease
MGVAARVQHLTFDDFCHLVKDGQKGDLINGVIYMASPDNTDANKLFVWLLTILNLFVLKKKLGEIYGSRVAFLLNDKNAPEPDLAFVRRDRLHRV